MDYRVVNKKDAELVLNVVFDGKVIETAATDVARQRAEKSIDPKMASVHSNKSLLQAQPNFDEIMRNAIQNTFYSEYDQLLADLKVVAIDAPYLQLLSGDFSNNFMLTCTITILEEKSSISYKNLEIRYHPIVASGDEVAKRIKTVCEQYSVDTASELIEKTQLYPNVDTMQARLTESFEQFVEEINRKAIADAVRMALVRQNNISVPDAMIERCVDGEIVKIVSQIGESMFRQHLESSAQTIDSFKETIRRRIVNVPRLEIILDAIVCDIGVAVTEKDLLAKIEEQRMQSLQPSQEPSAKDTLLEIKKSSNLIQSLTRAALRDRAVDYVRDTSKLVTLSPIIVEEYLKKQRSSEMLF